MFERYTEAARRTLFFARYEASQLGNVAIEPAHMLLGLLRDRTGVTRGVFTRSGLAYENAYEVIRAHSDKREKVATSVEIPFSAGTKRILQYAMQEADRFGHNAIGSEHLLLGLLHENDSVAAPLLTQYGLTLDSTRETILQLLADGVEPSWDAQPESMEPRHRIETMKHAVLHLGSEAEPGAQGVVSRIVQYLEELKRFFR